MINTIIKGLEQINTNELTVKQMLKISLSQKRYLLIHKNKLYFTNDIKRLIRDKFSQYNVKDIDIYQL